VRCAIHQPQFLPWLGHFHKIAMADVFVFLDNVQFQKNEFQNRNRIPGNSGSHWLTVPVSHRFSDEIRDVRIADGSPWRRKILGAVEHAYGKAPHFAEFYPTLQHLLEQDWGGLAALNMASVSWIMSAFGIETRTITASELEGLGTDRTGRLVDICRAAGADIYVSGSLAQRYLEVEQFTRAGIQVEFQKYDHPVYEQSGGGPFLPHMSAVDGLFNCGGGADGRKALSLG
jgi:hypothetical protein